MTSSSRRLQSGQMLLGACAFLLIAAASALALLRIAHEDVAAFEDLEQIRGTLLREASLDAAKLNEVAINQSLILWHLGAALRVQLEFAEGGLLHAATTPFHDTTEIGTRYPREAVFTTFRNALSARSSRHLYGATDLLARNQAILDDLGRVRPGFLATLNAWPVGDAWCAVAARWGNGPALAFPGLSALTRIMAGSDHFKFDEGTCTFRLGSRSGPVFLAQNVAWDLYVQEVVKRGGRSVPLYLPNASLSAERKNALLRESVAPRGRFRVQVRAEHPDDGEPESLLIPKWAAFPTDVSREK